MSDYAHYLDLVSKDRLQMIDLLVKWSSINSGTYNFKGLKKMAATLAESFSLLPGELQMIDLGPNKGPVLQSVCRANAPMRILFNGHMDTVYGEESSFQNCTFLDKNILQGPGVTDMKGGLVILYEVLKIFEQTPWAKNIGWEILIDSDEEIGSPYSAPLLEEAAKRNHLGLIFEPSLPDGSLVRSRKGTAIFTISAKGQAGHAGRNFNSEDNAIIGLSHFLIKVDELNRELPGCIFNVGAIEGGGVVNTVPEVAYAKIAVRYVTYEDKKRIEERFAELTASVNKSQKVQIEFASKFMRPPKMPSSLTDALYKKFESCGKELGMALGWKDSGGASDGNNLAAAGLINIDNLGAEGDNIHSSEEYIVLESLVRRAQLTLLFLMKLASREITLPDNVNVNSR